MTPGSQTPTYAKNNQQNKATGHHFNMPGHSWKNMQFIILEKVLQNDKTYREEREKYLIQKFGTYRNGMNRQPQKALFITVTFVIFEIYTFYNQDGDYFYLVVELAGGSTMCTTKWRSKKRMVD